MKDISILKKNREYKRVYSRGKYVADRFIVMYYLPNSLGEGRLGFSVSKKVGKAVVRNRIRRLFKEACRLNRAVFPKGYDIIFLARSESPGRSYRQVEESVLKLLKRAFNK